MMELAGYVLEPLRVDSEFTLYRGRQAGNADSDPGAGAVARRTIAGDMSGGSNTRCLSRATSIRHGRYDHCD